jgi:membrane-bound inhibitor of C-type lysozyme
MSTKLLALALAAVLLAAPAARAESYVNFSCADGSKISLIFENQGTGLVMIGGGALRLQNRHPASGLWYASPHGELRAKGSTATFRVQGRAPTSCRKVR